LRIVRKLSKDNSKLRGKTAKPRTRMPAPTLVISVTQHERTPVCPLKNSNAPLAIFVLPIDLRSFILRGVLNEFLINPMAPIVAPPDFSKDEPARDRSSRDKDGPQMPCLSPGRRRAQVLQVMIIAVSNHARPLSKEQSRQTAYDGPTVTLSHDSTLSHRFVSVLPRGLRRIAAAASAFLTRWRRSCSSRYSVSSERSKLVRALGFVR
jgi:hypothetical protein